ncbi:MAG: hypothetical protein ACTSR2_07015 [Candidatus Hodarchaeales archaeon]
MNKKPIWKKVVAVGVGGLLLGCLGGCTLTGMSTAEVEKEKIDYLAEWKQSQEGLTWQDSDNTEDNPDVDNIKQLSFDEGVSSVDITEDNEQAISDAIAEKIANGELEIVLPEGEAFTEDGLDFGTTYVFTLTDKDLERLDDSDIEFDDEDYKTWEEIRISTEVEFDNPKFEGVSGLSFEKGDLEYRRYVKSTLDLDDISTEDSLKLNFLNKEIEITDWDEDEATVCEGVVYFLKAGEDAPSGVGKLVFVEKIGENSVKVVVDGEEEYISEGDKEEVNGVEVWVKSIYYEENPELREVEIEIAKDIVTTIKDGEPAEMLGYDDDNDKWLYTVGEKDGNPYIGIKNNDKWTFHKDDDDHNSILFEGNSLELPLGTISYDLEDDYEYYDLSMMPETLDLGEGDVDGIMFRGLFMTDDEEYSKIFCDGSDLYYKEDGDWHTAETVEIDDTELELFAIEGYCGIGEGLVYTNTDFEAVYVNEEDESETDHTLLLENGVKVLDVEDNFENEEINLEIPEETVKGELKVI